MVEMRHVYAQTLLELGEQNSDIVVLEADLMRAFGTKIFKERFPDRVFNIGVAEANMMGIAAGLSTVGKKPFVHTFAPFATRRCYDQFYVSVNYTKQEVKVTGFDPGVTAAFNGGTHMSFEDIALMRVIPKLLITEPADFTALQAILPMVTDHKGSTYMRLQRAEAKDIYDNSQDFELGKGIVHGDGSDLVIIASGPVCVLESLKAIELLRKDGIYVTVIDMFTIKPLDKDLIVQWARRTGAILTCENHQVHSGLGAGVAELVSQHYPVIVRRHGVHDEFGEVGTLDYLKERYELTAQNIAEYAKQTVKDKEQVKK